MNPLSDEHTVEVELTNFRPEALVVCVLETLSATARVTESSVPAAPADPGTVNTGEVEFHVSVPAHGKAILR